VRAFDHFAYPLRIDPGVGAIAEEDDYNAYIRSLILQTIMTAQGERINRPGFGCSIRRLVFAPLTAGIESFVQSMIIEAMDRWLGYYVGVDSVRVTVQSEKLLVELDYVVLANGETRYLTMEVTP
jgi:phage baseplate assembly protein W